MPRSFSKECWKTIIELLQRQSKTTSVNHLEVDGTNITGDTNTPKSFNKYFSTIGPKLANNIRFSGIDPLSYVSPASSAFQFQSIDSGEIRSVLNLLKSNKSPGHDNITIKLLMDVAYSISDWLPNIFNLSIQTRIFPDDWKIVYVTPIYKDGSKTDRGYYRPISIISTVAKYHFNS